MKINNEGLNIIKSFEGLRLSAYKDPVGVWSIGYGHTQGVKATDKITADDAEELLKSDVALYEAKVNGYNGKYNFNENEFSALVSFAYNLGTGSIDQVTAMGTRTKQQIADKMLLYNKAGGKTLAGLTSRRKVERELFLKAAVPEGFTEESTIKDIVDAVFNGEFGNGNTRKESIYTLIQSFVNKRR